MSDLAKTVFDTASAMNKILAEQYRPNPTENPYNPNPPARRAVTGVPQPVLSPERGAEVPPVDLSSTDGPALHPADFETATRVLALSDRVLDMNDILRGDMAVLRVRVRQLESEVAVLKAHIKNSHKPEGIQR